MRSRWVLVALVLVTVIFITAGPGPVQAQGKKKVFQISMVSFKFTPNLIQVNQGDTVVLQFLNDDPAGRNHSFASRLMLRIPYTVRGTYRTGIDDERRFFASEPGQRFEVEFVATERGSFSFVCEVFDHGARGQTGAINVLLPAEP